MTPASLPWYKQRWPWLLISGPLIVVIAAIITMVIAVRTADPLVNDDYYKRGKEINIELSRDNEAVRLHLSGQVMFGDNGKNVRVMLNSPDQAAPDTLTLLMLHPTLPEHDRTVNLKLAGQGFYVGEMTLPSAAHWFARVQDSQDRWRLQSEWRPSENEIVQLKNQPAPSLTPAE